MPAAIYKTFICELFKDTFTHKSIKWKVGGHVHTVAVETKSFKHVIKLL